MGHAEITASPFIFCACVCVCVCVCDFGSRCGRAPAVSMSRNERLAQAPTHMCYPVQASGAAVKARACACDRARAQPDKKLIETQSETPIKTSSSNFQGCLALITGLMLQTEDGAIMLRHRPSLFWL